MFILVRHAVAVGKRNWVGSDGVRPLNPAGLQQSEHLAALLAPHRVTRLLSSPTVRCLRTLSPTSEQLRLEVQPHDSLAVNAPAAGLIKLLGSADVDHAVLCTHGETFAALSRAWGNTWAGRSGPPDLRNTPKGGCWIIENYNDPAATARYLGRASANRSRGPRLAT